MYISTTHFLYLLNYLFFIFSHQLTGSSAQPVVVAGWLGRPGLDLGHHSQNRHQHHRQQHRQYYHHHRHHHQHYHDHYLRTCGGGIRGWEPRVGQACRSDIFIYIVRPADHMRRCSLCNMMTLTRMMFTCCR